MNNMKLGIILCTTRQERVSPKVGTWILDKANAISKNSYEIVDIKDYPLPFFGESASGEVGENFNEKLKEFAGYIFVVGEYNHSIPAVLKNALDWTNGSIANKAAAIASYGAVGGARAAEHLRAVLAQLQVADISRQVLFSIFTDFENFNEFKPQELHNKAFEEMIEQLESWALALKNK